MTKKEIIADIIREFPDEQNRTIARIAHKKYPTVFPTVDSARDVVRTARGARGEKVRRQSLPDLKKPIGWQQNVMPRTLSKKRENVVIKGKHKILVLSDIHIPYHDEKAVEAAIEYGKKQKPDIILLNGDIGDFYAVSRHDKDPRRSLFLSDELDLIRQFLFWLRKQFPKARILYKIGNHENRLERFLVKEAPALIGTTDFEIASLLRFDELRIECVGSLNLVKLGKLSVYHGHELPQGMSSPVNPARGIWMRVQETMMAGHWHRVSEHTETTGISKQVSSCWSTGCLCDLSPDYAIVNRWSHGFAIVEVQEDGEFEVHNHKIIKGRVY